jgi:hypothetical protein
MIPQENKDARRCGFPLGGGRTCRIAHWSGGYCWRHAPPGTPRIRRPLCKCQAYPWPHTLAGGLCCWPDPPTQRWVRTKPRDQRSRGTEFERKMQALTRLAARGPRRRTKLVIGPGEMPVVPEATVFPPPPPEPIFVALERAPLGKVPAWHRPLVHAARQRYARTRAVDFAPDSGSVARLEPTTRAAVTVAVQGIASGEPTARRLLRRSTGGRRDGWHARVGSVVVHGLLDIAAGALVVLAILPLVKTWDNAGQAT